MGNAALMAPDGWPSAIVRKDRVDVRIDSFEERYWRFMKL